MQAIEDIIEIDKATPFIIIEILEYAPDSLLIKTIIRKTSGNVSAVSFDSGEILKERISPFDTYIQVIDGQVEIIIDNESHFMETGQSIIIPANVNSTIKTKMKFKMVSTFIKKGNDEVEI